MDKNKVLKTKAKNALKSAGILYSDDNCHTILDVSRLRSVADDELKRLRNIGTTTIEFINDFKSHMNWL